MKLIEQRLWAIVQDPKKSGGVLNMCYMLGPSEKEVWEAAIEAEMFGTGYTKKHLQSLGYRAVPVGVFIL